MNGIAALAKVMVLELDFNSSVSLIFSLVYAMHNLANLCAKGA